MKGIRVILQIAGLYAFYLLGTWIEQVTKIPIPGSIIGMLLLFAVLMTGKINIKLLESGADFLLAYLPLLFLPSVIGVMKYGTFFIHKGLLLAALVAINTIIVMAICSFTSQWLATKGKNTSIFRGEQH